MTQPYGASPDEWMLLEAIGLTADLLPVVSNPDAPISPGSGMKQKGKTPSVYNSRSEVAGLPNWTTYEAHEGDVAEWAANADYGICLQTRRIRALDLDIESAAEVAAIEKFVKAVLGPKVQLAIRRRPNSHKCLLAFEVTEIPDDEDLYKRTVQVKGSGVAGKREMIEFLATGQQFVAYGTHPSGVRYVWENEGEYPSIPLHVYESLWERICTRFGTSEPTSSQARKRGLVLKGVSDRIITQLEERGVVLGWGKDGQAHIECPNAAEHSADTGLAQTSYFPAGTGGYELGHFHCLHAHCEHLTDQDYMDKLGIHNVAPAVLAAIIPEPSSDDTPRLPAFKRDDHGRVMPTAKNIELALSAPHACGYYIARDTFLEEIMLRPWVMGSDPAPWRRLADEDYFDMRVRLESFLDFDPLNTGTVRDALHAVARRQQFDSATEFVESLKWDGVPRVDRFFGEYVKVSDPAFGRAVGRYLFTALAGRALQPGVKADMVPMLISSEQGLLKTSTIEALAPIPDVFTDLNLATDEDKRIRLIKGKMVAEIGEMRGLHGTSLEDVKNFISRRIDKWIPKYKEQSVDYPRRCVFIGTGNNPDLLNDPTGSRRFLPMTVTAPIDVAAVRHDCYQLWAEGAVLFKAHGVIWDEAQQLSGENNEAYTIADPWIDVVRGWLEHTDVDGKTFLQRHNAIRTVDVLTHGLGHQAQATNSGVGKRVGEVMRSLGFVRRKVRFSEGHREHAWVQASKE